MSPQLPKIYVFCNAVLPKEAEPYNMAAIDEEGNVLATAAAGNLTHGRYLIGATSHQNHDKFKATFPDGYVVVYISPEEVAGERNKGFNAALLRGKLREGK